MLVKTDSGRIMYVVVYLSIRKGSTVYIRNLKNKKYNYILYRIIVESKKGWTIIMKNKWIRKILISVAACSITIGGLMGCSGEPTEKEEISAETEIIKEEVEKEETAVAVEEKEEEIQKNLEESSVYEGELIVNINGVDIKIGDNFATVADSVGEPDDYQAAKSCTGEGDEKIYQYGGICVYTTPSGGQDNVYIIELTGQETMPTGIGVGSSKQEVINVYGENYSEEDNYLSYEWNDNITLGFEFDGDAVSFVEIYG